MFLLEQDAVVMHVLSPIGKKGSQRISNRVQRAEFEESGRDLKSSSRCCLFLL